MIQHRKWNPMFVRCLRCLTPDAPHNYCTLTQLLSFFVPSQQSLTLWLAARPASPRWLVPCPASARGAPVSARTLRPGDRGTPSVPSRNGWPIPSASWTPTPREKWVKSNLRRVGQRGVAPRRRFFPTLRLSRGLWNRPAATPPSPQEKRWDWRVQREQTTQSAA